MLKRKEVIMNNGIYRVIQEGTSLMGNQYLNEEMVRTWLEYSLKMLDLVCGNTFIKYQYSSFAFQVMNSPIANSTSKCKITKCFYKSTPLVLRNSISFLVSH